MYGRTLKSRICSRVIDMSFRLIINEKRCNACGNCWTACPTMALVEFDSECETSFTIIKTHNGECKVLDVKGCNGCGICIEACYNNAIQLKFLEAE